MRKMVGGLLTLSLVMSTWGAVSAHPGRTVADGMHYCRTNCDDWGVPWNQRHGHGGSGSSSGRGGSSSSFDETYSAPATNMWLL